MTDEKKEELLTAYDAFLHPAPTQPNPDARPLTVTELFAVMLALYQKNRD
jgi:hypothetical protein